MMTHLWALCDALAAAITTAKAEADPPWTVTVLIDPQTEAKSHPQDEAGVELHIGPMPSSGQRAGEEGNESRVLMQDELTIGVRMRTRRVETDTVTLARSKSLAFDDVLEIAMRRSGMSIGTKGQPGYAGQAHFANKEFFIDLDSLREDALISVVCKLTFRLTWRPA